MTAPMTLGRLARAAGMARASLLHYEALGLLRPAGRSAAGYRLYGEAELQRLRTIRRFREAGLTLAEIGELLESPAPQQRGRGPSPAALLERRLLGLSGEIERLRGQQKVLARLLASAEFRAGRRCHGKSDWVAMLAGAGFSEEDMLRWHVEFEAESPQEHAVFLHSLGLAPQEIAAIRRVSRKRR